MKTTTTVLAALLAALLLCGAVAQQISPLAPKDLQAKKGKQNLLVEIVDTSCGQACAVHDYQLIMTQAAFELGADSGKVEVVKANVTAHPELADQLDFATGSDTTPCLRLITAAHPDKVHKIDGNPSHQILEEWVSQLADVQAKASSVVILDAQNFQKVVKAPKKHTVVEFYAPWCGYCKMIASDYEKVGHTFKGESSVTVAKTDCTTNPTLCQQYGVNGYPTMKYFAPGSSTPEDVQVRDGPGLTNFINQKAGTHRVLGGSLGYQFGTLPQLDDLASQFMKELGESASPKRLQELTQQAKNLIAESDQSIRKHLKSYGDMMSNAISKGRAFLDTESEKISSMLSRLTTDKATYPYYKAKINVLSSFVPDLKKGFPDFSYVKDLDPTNFDEVVDGSRNVLVEFYAPWCGHCKTLAPEYEDAASKLASDDVVLAKVAADTHRTLGDRFGVRAFPTLKWFPKGSLTPEDMKKRTSVDIVSFVRSKLSNPFRAPPAQEEL